MKSKVIIFALIVTFSSLSFGQVDPGARQVALAHSDISSVNDAFAVFVNPAGLSNVSGREIGFFYSPAPFGIKQLASGNAAFVEPTDYGAFAAGFSIYGYELYKETRIALGYSKKVTSFFTAGGSIYYHNISIKNYGNSSAILLNVGATARVSKEVGFGAYIENLTQSSVGDEANQIPSRMWFGSDFRFIEELVVNLALVKEIGFKPSIRIGAEYNLLNYLRIRLGSGNQPNNFAGGIGIVYNMFEFDYAMSNHSDLGTSHQFGLLIRLTK